jgi:myo-inositol-1(or 4)-monophosphatase
MAMLGDKAMFAHPAWPTPWPPMRIESRNSIAYRLCLVACGAFDGAFAPSGKADWDLAAADLIAGEAGAVICDVKGRPFTYNRPSPRQAGLVCAAPGVAPLILERLAPIAWPNPT